MLKNILSSLETLKCLDALWNSKEFVIFVLILFYEKNIFR